MRFEIKEILYLKKTKTKKNVYETHLCGTTHSSFLRHVSNEFFCMYLIKLPWVSVQIVPPTNCISSDRHTDFLGWYYLLYVKLNARIHILHFDFVQERWSTLLYKVTLKSTGKNFIPCRIYNKILDAWTRGNLVLILKKLWTLKSISYNFNSKLPLLQGLKTVYMETKILTVIRL